MTTLVTISQRDDVALLRRYEGGARMKTCTHSGRYDADGVTISNVEYYRERGAHQDAIARPDRHNPGPRRRPA